MVKIKKLILLDCPQAIEKVSPFHIIVLAWQFLNYNANLDELLAAFSG